MATKTNSGLLAYAKAQVGLPYWYGCYGQIATAELLASKKKQYPSNYTASDFTSQIGKRVHDCVGLPKGYLWSDTTTSTPKYNSAQDTNAKGMYAAATTKGKISTLPKTAGLLVFKGASTSAIHHVGVYDGDKYVYEAKGHAYGVVKTTFKASDWDYWAQCPYCTDDTSTASTSSSSSSSTSTYTKTQFIKDVQSAIGVTVDGVAGSKTLAATPTLSATKNRKHAAVKPVQKYLYALGYTSVGTADGIAGTKFTTAVKAYQKANSCEVDGEITAKAKTWKKLLGLA